MVATRLACAAASACCGKASFGALTLGQIEHERDTLVSLFVERGPGPTRTGTAAACPVRRVLFLRTGWRGPSHIYILPPSTLQLRSRHDTLRSGRQGRPAHAPRDQNLAVISHPAAPH